MIVSRYIQRDMIDDFKVASSWQALILHFKESEDNLTFWKLKAGIIRHFLQNNCY